MRKRMKQLLDEFDCSTSVIFSTKDHVSFAFQNIILLSIWIVLKLLLINWNGFYDQSHAKDKYFYDSAEKISFFFEGLDYSLNYTPSSFICSSKLYWKGIRRDDMLG